MCRFSLNILHSCATDQTSLPQGLHNVPLSSPQLIIDLKTRLSPKNKAIIYHLLRDSAEMSRTWTAAQWERLYQQQEIPGKYSNHCQWGGSSNPCIPHGPPCTCSLLAGYQTSFCCVTQLNEVCSRCRSASFKHLESCVCLELCGATPHPSFVFKHTGNTIQRRHIKRLMQNVRMTHGICEHYLWRFPGFAAETRTTWTSVTPELVLQHVTNHVGTTAKTTWLVRLHKKTSTTLPQTLQNSATGVSSRA